MVYPIVCTSISRRRLAEARLLARAVAAHHPGDRLVVLVVDDPADGATTRIATGAALRRPVAVGPGGAAPFDEPFVRLCPADLGVDPRIVHELALCRDGDDLAACLVPALVARLCGEARPVVALSPEVVLLAPLDGLAELADSAGVVLVPRLLAPLPVDDRDPSEAAVVAAGAYDPGIVAVAPGADGFLDWWASSLRSAAASPDASPATSQPALGVALQSFGAQVTRDPGVGVAYWNAHERALTWSDDAGYRASAVPLRLVHLQGFDPSTPQLMAPAAARRPRVLLSGIPALWRLCRARATELAGEAAGPRGAPGSRGAGELAGAVRLADGTVLDARMRRIVRRALLDAGPRGASFPDPFDPAQVEGFHDWLASPDPGDPVAPTLPRYIGEIYGERRDLQWHFPRVGTVDMAHFRDWVASHGLDEAVVPGALRSALVRTPWWAAPTGVVVAAPETLRTGVVLAGYLRAESGVGEAARLAFDAMRSASVDVVPAVLGLTPSRQRHPFAPDRTAPLVPVADRKVNVIWTSADQLPGFASIAGPDFFAGRYNVGFWAWETEAMPAAMAASSAMLDEIWVPSAYVRDAVQPVVDRPVQVFPHPIVAPPVDRGFDPAKLGIPAGFCFLFTYDFLSSFARKNPLGVLEAFMAAFAPGEGPVLVLKSVNGDLRPAERERLVLAASGRPDVVVVDEYLSASERGALLASCDCFVSLHRAEGFGLGLGEAMALARPVIATRYSGNLEFMDDETALLVPAERVAVGPGAAPYGAGDHWGEPDLEVATEHMRRVVEDPGAASALGRLARERVLAEHGSTPAERFVARRLGEIEKLLRKGYVSDAANAVRRML